jgi:hypothetical protein
MFPRNVGLLPNYMALQLRRQEYLGNILFPFPLTPFGAAEICGRQQTCL